MNMTTPTNEEVRRQFEAQAADYSMPLARDSSGVYVDPDTQNAWFFYQAALSSPAVVALVEALRVLAAYPLEEFSLECKPERKLFGANDWELMAGQVLAARAALAPFTTGAGHVE